MERVQAGTDTKPKNKTEKGDPGWNSRKRRLIKVLLTACYGGGFRTSGPEVASHIVLNIYDDDHYRNLDSLRSIRSVPPTSFKTFG